MNARLLAEKSLNDRVLTREEAGAVLAWPEDDLFSLLAEVHRVRRARFGKKVKLNFLANIKSGLCPEDCSYCSQSKVSKAPIDKYKLMPPEEIVKAAEEAVKNKAARLCLVASGRGPSDKDISQVAEAVRAVKASHPGLEICCCLGLLQDGQGGALKEAGVHAYNHNLNTSEGFYDKICNTHGFKDRMETVENAKASGLSACSGALFGMGETEGDILDVAFQLRALGADSIPLNFLIPIEGTPLARREDMTPLRCLRILCLFRLLCPRSELRIAGGRELHLRTLQPLGLLIANSIFIGDYLTTAGQAAQADIQMIRDLGFEIVGEIPDGAPAPSIARQVTLLSQTK